MLDGKISRSNDDGLTTTGLIIVCVLVSVAAIIILLAVLGKF
jgi:hypothetical protein